ncbi:cytochrome c3 family protein [Planctomycetota bacterium]
MQRLGNRPFVHGPYAAKECYQCHGTSSSAGFKSSGGRGTKPVAEAGQWASGMVVEPGRKLCVECHTQKSAQRAWEEGLWLHGPAADGSCGLCHSPHQSTNPYLLREMREKICAGCHSEGHVDATIVQGESEDCMACHNPHLGKDASLLRKNHNEIF